jgi:hypothetical protein
MKGSDILSLPVELEHPLELLDYRRMGPSASFRTEDEVKRHGRRPKGE